MNALWAERDLAVTEIARRFVTHPWPTEFLLIVDPLVTWIWLGRADHGRRRPDRAVAGAVVRAPARRPRRAPGRGRAGAAGRESGPRAGLRRQSWSI